MIIKHINVFKSFAYNTHYFKKLIILTLKACTSPLWKNTPYWLLTRKPNCSSKMQSNIFQASKLMHIQACFFELPKLLNFFSYLHTSFFELWKLLNASNSLHASKSKLANFTNPSNYIYAYKMKLSKLFNLCFKNLHTFETFLLASTSITYQKMFWSQNCTNFYPCSL